MESQSENIAWWYKNGNNGKNYFGIKYTENEEVHTFYPDYLVKFCNGKLGIFDTKSGNTAKDAAQKSTSLLQYVAAQNEEGKNLIGGIIIQDEAKNWRINRNLAYQYDKKNLSKDWDFLKDVC